VAYPSRTILVVDDDAALRAVLADALEGEDYRVIQAARAQDALEMATRVQPNLILLDLALPQHSGIELLQQIKGSAPTREIPVLIMSGYALVFVEDAVRQADGTLGKPFDLTDLLSRVNHLSAANANRSR
jgi:two-component system phosphate regulon response regulator PhoB